MFIAALFTRAKIWNQPKSMIDWILKNVAHIHHGIPCSCRKKDEFMSFAETWMNLETIILSKLTQEQKIKHRMFSLTGRFWTMGTHGQREGSTTHWGLSGGNRGGTVVGRELERDSMGRNARYRWWWGRQQITLPCVYLYNNLACSSHVPPNLKCN